MAHEYKILFSDIGGVLLSNGWGHLSRMAAAEKFGMDYTEMNVLHEFIFNVYEMGKIDIDDYLDTVVFHRERNFSRAQFKDFMFEQSVQLPSMLPWLIDWRKKHPALKVISINNEPHELNHYRINKFQLHNLFDSFISSCAVGMRKPDPQIFQLALGIAQVPADQCLYLDDRIMLVKAARKLGIHAYHHTSFENTQNLLESKFL